MLVAFRMIQKLAISDDRFMNKSYYRIGYIRYYNPVFYHNNRGNRKQLYRVCSFNWRREEPARFNGGERNGNWVIMHSWLRWILVRGLSPVSYYGENRILGKLFVASDGFERRANRSSFSSFLSPLILSNSSDTNYISTLPRVIRRKFNPYTR